MYGYKLYLKTKSWYVYISIKTEPQNQKKVEQILTYRDSLRSFNSV
jgi:hypothetical protein